MAGLIRTRKSYRELIKLGTFEERYEYLKLNGTVGALTFGSKRWVNQRFYSSQEWRRFRNEIILRDSGCDLGILDREIHGKRDVYIHHINPITEQQVLDRDPEILNPDNAITVTYNTHAMIHYGNSAGLRGVFAERTPHDTLLWTKQEA